MSADSSNGRSAAVAAAAVTAAAAGVAVVGLALRNRSTAATEYSSTLVFALNGERIELDNPDPNLSLNEFIRHYTKYTGTKSGCGEGGCGACAVLLTVLDGGKERHFTINSCLKPVCSLDGCSVTTVEVLSKHGCGVVQQRLAAYHGSQCGFCSPGMVMAIYGSLKKADDADRQATIEELENSIDGNLCRCTGYRPILDAAKSFAQNDFVSSPPGCDHSTFPPLEVGALREDVPFPDWLRSRALSKERALRFVGGSVTWVRPVSLAAAMEQLADPNARPVFGGTGRGVYKSDGVRLVSTPKTLVDLGACRELCEIQVTKAGLVCGAGATIAQTIAALESCKASAGIASHEKAHIGALNAHLSKIAGHHVRNAGTLGGNLVLAKTEGFESDLATLCVGIGATLSVCTARTKRSMEVGEWLRGGMESTLPLGAIVTSITIPFASSEAEVFRSYKVALRPQNSHALVNAAFRVTLSSDRTTIRKACLAFGAVGAPTAIRAPKTEAALIGPVQGAFARALPALSAEVVVPPREHRAAHRTGLVLSFLFKFASTLGDSASADSNGLYGSAPATPMKDRPVSQGLQSVRSSAESEAEHAPVGQPIAKLSAPLQTSGEAMYTGDVALGPGTLYAALAVTCRARVRITRVNVGDALAQPGVVRVLTAADVPGENACVGWWNEAMLAAERSDYAGQPCAVVVAKTQHEAQAAAFLVSCDYEAVEGEALMDGEPILGIADAKERNSFFFAPDGTEKHRRHWARGDASSGLVSATHTLRSTAQSKSQSHFYMEPHNAFASPQEGGTILIGSSMQWPNGVQDAVARCLDVPLSNVEVTVRRVGGGFGGKLTRHVPVAAACALAADALQAPVRLNVNRNVDMLICGGRHAMEAEFEVGFNDDGLITALKIEAFMSSGHSSDLTDFCVMSLAKAVDQVYWIENFEVEVHAVQTNLPSRTAMRGPGEIQASYLIEEVIFAVASELVRLYPEQSLDETAQRVRLANMYPADDEEKLITHEGIKIEHYTAPLVWKQLQLSCNFQARASEVLRFNSANKYVKRGIAMTPVKYWVSCGFRSALVNVYSDGSVRIAHAGVEIGQGIHTKVVQAAAHALGQLKCSEWCPSREGASANGATGAPPLSMFTVSDTNTSTVPNMSMTGGSTTSEACAEAVRIAIAQLIERLRPVYEELLEKNQRAPTWMQVVKKAIGSKVDLSSQASYDGKVVHENGERKSLGCRCAALIARNLQSHSLVDHNFGAACSEIELDILTGETTILRTDILYDCGKSLNPAIDMGQSEGGFMKGVGFFLREDLVLTDAGQVDSNGTWEYKIPGNLDVPLDLRVSFLQDSPFPKGILSSKASGEPPLVLATSVFAALRHAIAAARRQSGEHGHFTLNTPATVDVIAEACGVKL